MHSCRHKKKKGRLGCVITVTHVLKRLPFISLLFKSPQENTPLKEVIIATLFKSCISLSGLQTRRFFNGTWGAKGPQQKDVTAHSAARPDVCSRMPTCAAVKQWDENAHSAARPNGICAMLRPLIFPRRVSGKSFRNEFKNKSNTGLLKSQRHKQITPIRRQIWKKIEHHKRRAPTKRPSSSDVYFVLTRGNRETEEKATFIFLKHC